MTDFILPDSVRQQEVDDDISSREVAPGSRNSGVIIQPMPCTLHFIDGKRFVVPEVEGWGYVDVGVFATGHFANSPNVERNILVPYERIGHYELDFDALQRYIEAQANEEETDERDSGGGPAADEGQPKEAS